MSKRPIVRVSQGDLQGLERDTKNGKKIYTFKGIPFAEPPVGNLRFKNPVPAKPWTGILDASKEGNNCSQISLMKKGACIGDEDCLFLNIFTPSKINDKTKRYPVVYYIHGGGLSVGSGDEDDFGPESIVENDIIVVTANYRLGVFGFLCLDIPEAPGNAALKDQLLALKWIKENIHHFNGDSENITIYGISAGSASVEYQLLNSSSEGLFHKAIMNSGAVLTSWARPRNNLDVIEKFANVLGVENEPYTILDKLNTMSSEEILIAALKAKDTDITRAGYLFTQFIPVVEKKFPNVESFLTKDPLDVYKDGEFVKVPTITTFCRDEGNMFPLYMGESLAKDVLNRKYADFVTFLNIKDKEEFNINLSTLYKAMNVDETTQMNEFLSDAMFLSGIYQSLKYLVRNKDTNHYTYMFNYDSPTKLSNCEMDLDAISGVPHATDMSYVITSSYYNTDNFTPKELKVKEFMTNLYTSFMKHSDPTASGYKIWKPTTEEEFQILEICGDGDDSKMVEFPFEDRMKYWDSLF